MSSELRENPFDPGSDPDRHLIWQRLVIVDSEAFARGDWRMIEDDFDPETFEGIRCGQSSDPEQWSVAFPTLESYRDSWLAASIEFRKNKFVGVSLIEALCARIDLTRIDLVLDRALCHKKFRGDLPLVGGGVLSGSRQTLYRLRRIGGRWKIAGFLGQLPL